MSNDRVVVPTVVLAATSSGGGKTTITAGLVAALAQQGMRVQPFKVGPDYIDPSYHTLAAGRPCRNLDSWMLGRDMVRESFIRNTREADIAISPVSPPHKSPHDAHSPHYLK